MKTKTIKYSYINWDNILDELVNAGKSFYAFYGDIESAIIKHYPDTNSKFEVTLTGDDDAWEEFDAIVQEVLYGTN